MEKHPEVSFVLTLSSYECTHKLIPSLLVKMLNIFYFYSGPLLICHYITKLRRLDDDEICLHLNEIYDRWSLKHVVQ